ncbi:MAG: hypothetical protein LUD14_05530 [Clostridiales bacterium]|nr:hypothetical protein [Clostridiales bacterium]
MHKYADYSIRITADPIMLRDRLIERHINSGKSRSDAESFVDFSDMPNVSLCLKHSLQADLNLQILADGSYRLMVCDRVVNEKPNSQSFLIKLALKS